MICRPERANLPLALRAVGLAGLLAVSLAACAPDAQSGDGAGAGVSADEAGKDQAPPSALLEEARMALEDNDLLEAARLLDEALGQDSADKATTAQIWTAIAQLRYRGGEHRGALEAVDRALEFIPRHPAALIFRGQMVRDAFGNEDALVWFEAALAEDPQNTEALREYAASLGEAGRYSAMLDTLDALGATAPRDPAIHFLPAIMAARAGNLVMAKSLLRSSGLVEGDLASARMLDALIDLEQGNPKSAAETLDRLVAEGIGGGLAVQLYALALWRAGLDEALIKRFGSFALEDAGSAYLAMLVGRAHERQGNRADAAPYLARAYQMREAEGTLLPAAGENTQLPQPTTKLRELLAEGNTKAARRYARDLVSRFEGSGDVAALAGDAAFANGNWGRAASHYEDALAIRRSWPIVQKALFALRKAGESDKANTLLASYSSGEPHNIDALIKLALLSVQARDWLRASLLLERIEALAGGDDPLVARLGLQTAKALGDEERAAQMKAKGWSLHPGMF